MKVLHVIPSVSARFGGPSRVIADMERALAARSIEVSTVTTNDDGNGRTLPVRCGAPIATPYATRWYFPRSTVFFKTSIGMANWLEDNVEAFDLVHAHGLFSFAPVAAAFLARRRGIPYILRPHGVLARYGMTHRRPLLKKVSLALIERRLLEAASAVHFTSRSEQDEAEALGLKYKGVVIPLGIDAAASARTAGRNRPSRTEPFKLLFLSRIDAKKNLESLMRAIALVSRNFPVMLTVAGGGGQEYLSRLHSLARALGIADRVNWLGHVEGERKEEALATAAAFVLPSYSENFGLAAVEALAAGLPCIVSRQVAIAGEIETAGAGLTVGTDVESIAVAIERLLREDEYLPMSTAARTLAASSFSLETMGERLEALYRDVRM
jgi:glycosyltransferase involved in cell wall biosynthesis